MEDKFNWDMKVKSVSKTEKATDEGDIEIYKVVLKDKDGLNEAVFRSAHPFKGLTPKSVLQISIKDSQMTIEEFKPPKEDN